MTDSIRFVARNRGRGAARDVLLECVRRDEYTDVWTMTRQARVEFGEDVEYWFTREGGVVGLAHVDGGYLEFEAPHYENGLTVRLSWSQEPRLHVRKSITSTYRL